MNGVSRSEAVVVGLIAFVILLLVAYCQGERHTRADDATQHAEQRVRAADSVRVVAGTALARADTVFVHDTLRFTRTLPPLAAIHDSVLVHLTDTLLVKQFVERSDSTVRACLDVVNSCAAFRVKATAMLKADTASIATRDSLLRLPKPREHFGVGLGFGYACNQKGCGPGLNVGLVWKW